MRMRPVTPDDQMLDHVKAMTIARLVDEGIVTCLELPALHNASVDDVLDLAFQHSPQLVIQTPNGRWLCITRLGVQGLIQ